MSPDMQIVDTFDINLKKHFAYAVHRILVLISPS